MAHTSRGSDHGLGRIPAPDPRDAAFLMEARFPQLAVVAPSRTSRYWGANGWWGDQGQTSMCVGYGWAHAIEDGPLTHTGTAPIVDPAWIYANAQNVDEFPGPPPAYDGTSVRAGAKVLQDLGYIASYHWAFDLATVVEAVLQLGPVVMGTDWYDGMFTPDVNGTIKATGSIAGGHCYLLDGANVKSRVFRLKNSWGRHWGNHGFAWIGFDDVAKLLAAQGESCIYVETDPSKRDAVVAAVAQGKRVKA